MLQLSSAGLLLQPAGEHDWPQILRLLAAAGLPTADLRPTQTTDFIVARRDALVVGAVGVESHGPQGHDGLLRSLVVAATQRERGIGRQLVAAAEQLAAARGLQSLTLPTQGAKSYFKTLGYRVIDRAAAPASLQATPQFAALCPASSTCMMKTIDNLRP